MDEKDWIDFIAPGGGLEWKVFPGKESPPDWEPGEGSNVDLGNFYEIHNALRQETWQQEYAFELFRDAEERIPKIKKRLRKVRAETAASYQRLSATMAKIYIERDATDLLFELDQATAQRAIAERLQKTQETKISALQTRSRMIERQFEDVMKQRK